MKLIRADRDDLAKGRCDDCGRNTDVRLVRVRGELKLLCLTDNRDR